MMLIDTLGTHSSPPKDECYRTEQENILLEIDAVETEWYLGYPGLSCIQPHLCGHVHKHAHVQCLISPTCVSGNPNRH